MKARNLCRLWRVPLLFAILISLHTHSLGYVSVNTLDNTTNGAVVNNDWVVAVNFPDFQINSWGAGRPYLGHAGVLLINGNTGDTAYFEYGRYDPKERGLVRRHGIPNAQLGANGEPTLESLRRIFHSISTQAGQRGAIVGAIGERTGVFQQALNYAEQRRALNTNPNRPVYKVLTNNCMHFVKTTLETVGFDTPCIFDPRPNAYIQRLRNVYRDIDYDPVTGQVVITP